MRVGPWYEWGEAVREGDNPSCTLWSHAKCTMWCAVCAGTLSSMTPKLEPRSTMSTGVCARGPCRPLPLVGKIRRTVRRHGMLVYKLLCVHTESQGGTYMSSVCVSLGSGRARTSRGTGVWS